MTEKPNNIILTLYTPTIDVAISVDSQTGFDLKALSEAMALITRKQFQFIDTPSVEGEK